MICLLVIPFSKHTQGLKRFFSPLWYEGIIKFLPESAMKLWIQNNLVEEIWNSQSLLVMTVCDQKNWIVIGLTIAAILESVSIIFLRLLMETVDALFCTKRPSYHEGSKWTKITDKQIISYYSFCTAEYPVYNYPAMSHKHGSRGNMKVWFTTKTMSGMKKWDRKGRCTVYCRNGNYIPQ